VSRGPHWDSENRCLWLDGRIIKTFRQWAPDQTALLDAFQERGWATHVFMPFAHLPGESTRGLKARLRTARKKLNKALPPGTIRFLGDGSGLGVSWQRCPGQPTSRSIDGERICVL
jgi:hypothetical protein